MHPELLNILVEPETHFPLALEGAVWKGSDIEKGILRSSSGNTYPIINGIPRFVKLENYATSFGIQWNRFSKTQLDSTTGCNYSRLRFRNEVTWDENWAYGKWILDAGCGAGRFAEIAAESSCKLVAMDMSGAIDVAKNNLSQFSNVYFVQANLYKLPFRQNFFDGVYCIGVLQHTPDPYVALVQLTGIISHGGYFAFTIYAKQPWTKLYSKYWMRHLVRNFSNDELLKLVEGIMPYVFPVSNVLFRIPILGKFFKFAIPIANYVEKYEMTKEQRYEEAVLDTLDMLSPKYDNPVTISHVINILEKCNVESHTILSRRPVNIVGQK